MEVGAIEIHQPADVAPQRANRRYSTDKDDPGYPPWKLLDDLGIAVHVYLNGLEAQDVSTADEGEGFIVRLARGADGRPYLTAAGDIATETVRGEVAFALRTR